MLTDSTDFVVKKTIIPSKKTYFSDAMIKKCATKHQKPDIHLHFYQKKMLKTRKLKKLYGQYPLLLL